MSVRTVVLYGGRRFSKPTYSTNQDPESLTLSLSDTASLSDIEVMTTLRELADAIVLAEQWRTSGNKVLADSAVIAEIGA